MTDKINKFKANIKRAAESTDHSASKDTTSFQLPPEGTTIGRLVDYIELGVQKRKPFKGKEKSPMPACHITFELLGEKYVREVEVNGVKKKIADRISIPNLPIMLDSRAKFKKLFEKMRYGRDDITHMSQMLGDAFKITITHAVVNAGTPDERRYANITGPDGSFLISPPVRNVENEAGEIVSVKKLKVPDIVGDVRLFLFDDPTDAMWESIFIDGEREVTTSDGKTKTVSRNYFQETIKKAENFEGSAVQAFLEGSDELPEDPEDLEEYEEDEDEEFEDEVDDSEDDLDDLDEELEEEEEEQVKKPVKKSVKSAEKQGKPKSQTTKTSSATSATTTSPSESDEALKELGLI